MNPAKHYEKFINEVLENRELWFLSDEERPLAAGSDGEYLPLWSKREYAEAMIEGEWLGSEAERIYLRDFIEYEIPKLLEVGGEAVVNMLEDNSGINVEFSKLAEDLKKGAEVKGFDWRRLSEIQETECFLEEKFEEILEKILQNGEFWTVFNGDNLVCLNDEDGEWFPIWTDEEQAAGECCGEWENCYAEEIPLGEFLREWLNYLPLNQNGVYLVPKTEKDECIRIDFENFAKALKDKAAEMGMSDDELYREDESKLRFVLKTVRNGELWTLGNDQGLVMLTEDLSESIPMFLQEDDAAEACSLRFESAEPVRIPLSELLDNLLPCMENDGIGALLITNQGMGLTIAASEFREALYDEIRRYNPRSPLLRNINRALSPSSDTARKLFN